MDDRALVEFAGVTDPGLRGTFLQLVKLDLSRKNFGPVGCEALATLLRNPGSKLTHLVLAYGRIDNSEWSDCTCEFPE